MEVLSVLFFVCLLVIAFLGGLLIGVLSKEESAPSASTNIPMQADAQIAAIIKRHESECGMMKAGHDEKLFAELRQLLHG